jgi:hypothetical protein
MKQTCVWCSQEVDSGGNGRLRNSTQPYAVCGCCVEHFTLPPDGPLQKYLDRLPFPVLVIHLYAGVYMITTAVNKMACDWTKKKPREIIQHLCGNNIECVYARLPGGCGNTAACTACTIKHAVAKTADTGEPQANAVLTLQRGDANHSVPAVLSITTMKAGRLVMLRIDPAE